MADGDVYILPTRRVPRYPLGRRGPNHDPANRLFRALVEPPPRRARPYKSWVRLRRDVYDQGTESSCTAQAAVGVIRTSNNNRKGFDQFASYDDPGERFALYRAAQTVDPWPGDDYDGTSTDAPFRVLRDRGAISSWRWLFGEDELCEWVRWYGPAAIGIEWYNAMFDPDDRGFITPTGGFAGGHAISVVGYDYDDESYELVNSWGLGWGRSGRCRLTKANMVSLLAADGEAVTIGAVA